MKKVCKIIIVNILLLTFLSCNSQSDITLEKADFLFIQMDTKKALNAYQRVWEDESKSKEDRSKAARMLAKMTWLIYQDNGKAFELLKSLETDYPQKTEIYCLWARILVEENLYDEAISKFNKALDYEENLYSRMDIKHEISKVILRNNLDKYNLSDLEVNQINNAIEEMKSLIDKSYGVVEYYKTLLGLSILVNDYKTLHNAWLGFFNVYEIENLNPKLKEAYANLKDIHSRATNKLNKIQVENLILGLAKSGFVNWASYVKKKFDSEYQFQNNEIDNYMHLNETYKTISTKTISFYRETALRKENRKQFRKYLLAEVEKLWNKLVWEGKQKEFDYQIFEKETRDKLGLVIRLYDNNYMGLHLGQAIHNEWITITQYGRDARLNYIITDHMISNGYEPWFWDGKATHPGWINAPVTIFRVRLPQISETAWRRVHDPNTKTIYEKSVEERSEKDIAIARKNPYAYLSGLMVRLRHESNKRFYHSLQEEGYRGEELKKKFITTFERHRDEGVVIHEARHAIDKQIKNKWEDDVFEFRGKMSEIIFCELPHAMLGYSGIISPDTGGKSAHGKANLQILKGLVKWIEEHQNEINGFDKKLPTLPQLDKLTEEQIKKAFWSMDPLSKE